MKAPLRVLIIALVVCVLVVILVCYKFGLFGGSGGGVETASSSTPASTASVPETNAVSSAAPRPTAEQLAHGKQLYTEKTCALCHGANGTADTPTGQAMKATNLTTGIFANKKDKNQANVAYILQVIENGVPGTAMVSFKQQIPNEQDRKDLAEYVNSLRK